MGSTFSSVIAIPPDLRYLSGIIHQSETTLRSVFCNTRARTSSGYRWLIIICIYQPQGVQLLVNIISAPRNGAWGPILNLNGGFEVLEPPHD